MKCYYDSSDMFINFSTRIIFHMFINFSTRITFNAPPNLIYMRDIFLNCGFMKLKKMKGKYGTKF